MANVKLKSIFTKEDIYTVLQLLKALADGADTNDADLQSQIDELKTKIDTLKPEPEGYAVDASGNVVINDSLHVAKTGDVEIGKNAIVDGTLTLNAPEDLAFKTGALDFSKAKYQHTVWMTSPSSGTYPLSIHFTAMSAKNVPIDSYQDLIEVFGGERLSVTGYAEDKNASYGVGAIGNAIFLDLHGGTISTDYVGIFADGETQESMYKIYLSGPAGVFLEISDDVCIPK